MQHYKHHAVGLLAIAVAVTGGFFVFRSSNVRAQVSSVNISGCGTLAQANTTYVLTQNVTTAGTCFAIGAHGITLDLNGKTVTYGTGSATRMYGVAVPSSSITRRPYFPDTNIPDSAFVGADNVTIRNGTIVQGGTGTESYAIYLWGADNLTVRDTHTTVQGNDTGNIYFNYSGHSTVFNNTMVNNSTVVTNRHQGRDVLGWEGGSGYLDVHDNTITGGPQYGIRVRQGDATGPAAIYRNTVNHHGRVANPYAIGISIDNASVYENTINPVNGRGIHIAGVNNADVYSNTITVREGSNPEYSPGWAQGIKIENGRNAKVHGNTITALAGNGFGHAYAIDISHDTTTYPVSNSEVYDNTLTATTPSTTYWASPMHLVGINAGNGYNIHDNTFITNNFNVFADYDSATDVLLRANTFRRTGTPVNPYILYFYTGSRSSTNIQLYDSNFLDGTSQSQVGYRAAGATIGYLFGRTATITVRRADGTPVNGATITSRNDQNIAGPSTTTNSSGVSTLRLPSRSYAGKPPVEQVHVPYSITVSAAGFSNVTVPLNSEQNDQLVVTLGQTASDTTPPSAITTLHAL